MVRGGRARLKPRLTSGTSAVPLLRAPREFVVLLMLWVLMAVLFVCFFCMFVGGGVGSVVWLCVGWVVLSLVG